MNSFPFCKMSGCGNDFIVVDNRLAIVEEHDLPAFIARICRRKLSVGADGLILIEKAEGAGDFKWRFYNSDGSIAEMCGNGARCAARFAYLNGIAGSELCFETLAGLVRATIQGEQVKVKMTDPLDLQLDTLVELSQTSLTVSRINTGVPHAAVLVPDIENVDVTGWGREIRFHPAHAPAGTNANFFSFKSAGEIAVRTYERGVEDETLACGTGAVACALVAAAKTGQGSPIKVLTRGGEYLIIHYDPFHQAVFHNVYLEGSARLVYKGELQAEAWR